MKQLLILSGKGGTGKTTLASAFIKFNETRAYADVDVDAPNLHLVTQQDVEPRTRDYFGLDKALIDQDLCTSCDICRQYCRFDAISNEDGYEVDPFACEGCGVCAYVCPADAIEMKRWAAGKMMLYKNKEVFSTAKLNMGSGNSGLMVTEVKKDMKENSDSDFAIIDGSPGIGCPVIASLSDVDFTLIVAEPSLSGISDMRRIIKTAALQGVETGVCVNKYDLSPDLSKKIEEISLEMGVHFLGVIPFDDQALEAVNKGETIADVDCPSGRAALEIFERILELMESKDFVIKRR